MDGQRPEPFVVVLTGGIAAGKTAVSDRFALLGVPVVDTDCIAHRLVEPGQPALGQIRAAFGAKFMDRQGRLDRRRMRRAIFEDPRQKARLEAILHPLIADEALREIARVDYPYCLLVVPLYAESARWPWVDRVLVVDAAERDQIDRLMTRDGISRQQAEAILAAQASRSQRLALADDVIHNDGAPERLQVQIEQLHARYLAMAGSRKTGPGR